MMAPGESVHVVTVYLRAAAASFDTSSTVWDAVIGTQTRDDWNAVPTPWRFITIYVTAERGGGRV